jgi:ribonuclease MRP protein subunit RMP1
LDEGEKSNWEKRISFLRARILPRCWVAFSGLVGDNQYAALGLMLLGTLGRLGRVVGWVREGEVGEEVVVVKEEVGGIGQEEEVEQENGGGMEVEEDLGVPLLREEVMQTKEAQIKENEKKPVRVESEAVSAKTEKAAAKKKRKKKHHDAIDELFSSLI